MKLITFNELKSFYSAEQRDEYNASSHTKKVVHFNPEHIVALESIEVGGTGVWPSAWEATRIYTVKGYWLVEGNANTIKEFISSNSNGV